MATSNGQQGFFTDIIQTIRNIIIGWKGTVGDPLSLADVAKIARVEPITLISSSLTGTKEMYEILHGILNLYTGFYLQAVHILQADLQDIKILKILDKVNIDRDLKTFLTSSVAYESIGSPSENIKTLSLEDCKFKLPMLVSDKKKELSFESIMDSNEDSELSVSIQKLDTFEKLGVAVGKVIELRFNVNQGKDSGRSEGISIPIVVRLDTMIVPSDVIKSIVASNTDDIRLGSRFKDAINGRISFIKDFLFTSDLIKAQKKTMIKDNTGYYTQMLKRVNNSRLYSALSGNISLAGISSIVIMSDEDEQEVQRKIGGKLTNQTTRDIVFDNTSAMMIAVISKEWERVSIYVRDIDGFSQNSFSDFKSPTNKDGNNIADILKAFSVSSAINF